MKTYILLLLLCVFSGCAPAAERSFSFPVRNTPEYTSAFQYSAPWEEDIYTTAYAKAEKILPDIREPIKGGVVPHHLVSAHTIAAFFETIQAQHPSTVVIIGPNHFDQGPGLIQSTGRDWKTPFGNVRTNHTVVQALKQAGVLSVHEPTFEQEHSMYSLIPFVRYSLPDTTVVPIVLKEVPGRDHLDKFIAALLPALPKDAVIIASVDFSHYQTVPVAAFHDERTMSIVRNSDFERLSSAEVDSTASLYTLLKLMEAYKTQHIVHEFHTNSAVLAGTREETETTSHYTPYFAFGKPDTERALSILQFGDMMLDRNVQNRYEAHGGPDYLFEAVAGVENRFFRGSDIVTANLEGPFANYRRETSKEIAFRFDPALIPTLQTYQFNQFTLANNHSLDMGRTAFEETKENLSAANIAFYGNQFTVQDDSLLIRETAGKKVAYLGLNDTHNSLSDEKTSELIAHAEAEADITIVNIHWGIEYEPVSHPRQQQLAHSWIDQGVDIIIGHHPHVVQEIEIYKDAPIFYSLGNFIFDQYFSVPTQQSLVVGMTLYDDKISLYVFPLKGEQSQVQHMLFQEGQLFMQDVFDRSRLGAYTFDSNFHLDLPFD